MTGKNHDRRLDRLETIWRATPGQDAAWEQSLTEVAAADGIVP